MSPGVLLLAAALAAPTGARPVSLAEALSAADHLAEMSAAVAAERLAAASLRTAARPGDLGVSLATRSITARESLAVSLPLNWLTQRGPSVTAGRADVEAAASARLGTRTEARGILQAAWFALATRTDRAAAEAERAARLKATADAVGALFEEGRVARLDQTRAGAEAALAASDAAGAEEERRAAAARLAILLGLDAETALVAEPRVEPQDEPPLESLRARTAETPAVLESAARARAGSARVDLARRVRWPGLGLEGGADFDDPTQPGTDKWIGIALSIPLAGGPGLDRARAEQEQAQAALERSRREAATGLESAWHAARAARLRYQALASEVLPAAREAADLSGVAYRAGRADLFRVLEAERALAEARLLHADAYEAWGAADAELRRFEVPEVP